MQHDGAKTISAARNSTGSLKPALKPAQNTINEAQLDLASWIVDMYLFPLEGPSGIKHQPKRRIQKTT